MAISFENGGGVFRYRLKKRQARQPRCLFFQDLAAILNAKQPTYPDSILTRLEKLERDLQELRKG